MMTLAEIEKYSDNICKEYGFKTVPISLNNRLQTTLGRTIAVYGEHSAKTLGIQISGRLANYGTETEIKRVVRHELAHYFATNESQAFHGHDKYWKTWAIKLKVPPTPYTSVSETYKQQCAKEYKYQVVCPKCGRVLKRYKTKCRPIRYPSDYTSTCCGALCKSERII